MNIRVQLKRRKSNTLLVKIKTERNLVDRQVREPVARRTKISPYPRLDSKPNRSSMSSRNF